MKNEVIGFIGIGNVGAKLAYNLAKKNKKLYIFDLNKKIYSKFKSKNFIKCKNINEISYNCSIFITCLPSPLAVNQVIMSLLPNIKRNHLWIEMSTTDKDEMIRLSKLIKVKFLIFVNW